MNPWRVAGLVILVGGPLLGEQGVVPGWAVLVAVVLGLILLFGPTRTGPRRHRNRDSWFGVHFGSDHGGGGWSDGGGDCGGGGGD